MKKSALFTIVTLTYALTSCGGGGGGDNTTTDNNNNNPPQDEPTVQQLNWVAPSTRTDGSFLDLSELGGFKLYAGTQENILELIADIQDSQATSYDLSSFAAGDYYFGIVAYDSDGLQSPVSDRIVKTITE
ncbi:MAG: hypothetical protein ABW104_08775 [Candidatus Thiodiazotropha sp. 6PLUC2]